MEKQRAVVGDRIADDFGGDELDFINAAIAGFLVQPEAERHGLGIVFQGMDDGGLFARVQIGIVHQVDAIIAAQPKARLGSILVPKGALPLRPACLGGFEQVAQLRDWESQ